MTDAVTSSTGNITGTVDPTAATKAASTSADDFGAGMDKDTFLKLLVAQLKYQDPLNPTNSDQYMQQMAQFTQVEKLADIQQSQTDLLTWQRTVAGQGMIGKEVTATPSDGTGKVDGKVVGIKLTDAGPRLVLDNGLTVSVDEVTDVEEAGASTTATSTAAPAASKPATSTSSTGTTSTGTTSTGTTSSGTPAPGTPAPGTPAPGTPTSGSGATTGSTSTTT